MTEKERGRAAENFMIIVGLACMLMLLLLLSACGGGSNNPSNNIPVPQGGWVCFACKGVNVGANGDFTFPGSGGAVGYIYTTPLGVAQGKTISLNYTVGGPGTVVPSPASGTGVAQVRLFLWRKGDDLACSSTTEWYRWWAKSAGPLTDGTYILSAPITWDQWTDCFAHQDSGQFGGAVANLLGVGFTFGAEFFGHGVYSTGQNTFTVNSFTVK